MSSTLRVASVRARQPLVGLNWVRSPNESERHHYIYHMAPILVHLGQADKREGIEIAPAPNDWVAAMKLTEIPTNGKPNGTFSEDHGQMGFTEYLTKFLPNSDRRLHYPYRPAVSLRGPGAEEEPSVC